MATVYIETSFVSAFVTDRTDFANLYRRRISTNWWGTQASRHGLFISDEVVVELSHPRFRMREAALEWIRTIPLLEVNQEARRLA